MDRRAVRISMEALQSIFDLPNIPYYAEFNAKNACIDLFYHGDGDLKVAEGQDCIYTKGVVTKDFDGKKIGQLDLLLGEPK